MKYSILTPPLKTHKTGRECPMTIKKLLLGVVNNMKDLISETEDITLSAIGGIQTFTSSKFLLFKFFWGLRWGGDIKTLFGSRKE